MPAEQSLLNLSDDWRKSKQGELLRLFEIAKHHRAQREERALEFYKLYVGYRNLADKETQEEHDDADGSSLHIPLVYRVVDTLRARMLKSLCSARPWIDFLPKPLTVLDLQRIDIITENAKYAAAQLDTQIEENDGYMKFYEYITDMLIFPAAIMSIGWHYETREATVQQEVTEIKVDPATGAPVSVGTGIYKDVEIEEPYIDRNELANVDWWDFWYDPRGGANLDTWRFCWHREYKTREEWEEYFDQLKERNEGTVFEVDWDKVYEGTDDAGETGTRWTRQTETGLGHESEDQIAKDQQLIAGYHYWTPKYHGIILNEVEIGYYGKNPYKHGKLPFIHQSTEPLPREPQGMSVAQLLEDHQHELNTSANQLIDAVNMIINRMYKARKESGLTDSDFVSRRGGVVWLDRMDDADVFQQAPIDAAIFQQRALHEKDAQDTVAASDVAMGGEERPGVTATEITTRNTGMSVRYEEKIMYFECAGFKRLAYIGDQNNQQFLEGEKVAKFYDDSGSPPTWGATNDEQRKGEHEYRPAASAVDPSANKEIRRGQGMQLLEVAAKTQNPYIKLDVLTKEVLHSFDLKNPDAMLRTEEEVMQLQAEQRQQEMEMQAAQAERQTAGRMQEMAAKGEMQAQADERKMMAGQDQQLAQLVQAIVLKVLEAMQSNAAAGETGAGAA
jgi:hypothetical protein